MAGALLKGNRYIRSCGFERAADEVAVRIEPKELRRHLNRLSYRPDRTPQLQAQAQQGLAAEAAHFLSAAQAFETAGNEGLVQLDIVTHASELRAYPFEAIYAQAASDSLDAPQRGVVLTRRIRAAFSTAAAAWPETPAVLFVHAPVDHDLPASLIEAHRRALEEALAPWAAPQDLERKGLLKVCEVDSVQALAQAMQPAPGRAPFGYVHVLAHGARVSEADVDESEAEWGLRLGPADSEAASPGQVAQALAPADPLPRVVTLAACDSADTDRPELGNTNLVEALHRRGVPVVVASQFPLTMPGSVVLAQAFYRRLLLGADVRLALHAARVALRQDARAAGERRHDWLSLVAYVRLPAEGYGQHLQAFALRVQLRLLEAARSDAQPLYSQEAPDPAACEAVAARLQDRIAQLQEQQAALAPGRESALLQGECAGLLASAYKSLAELRFVQARGLGVGGGLDGGNDGAGSAERERLSALSRAALAQAQRCYTQAFRADLSRHWQGMQMLALGVVLSGQAAPATDLLFVRYAAQNACEQDARNCWPCGTLAEALLLEAAAARAGAAPGTDVLAAARAALQQLVARAAQDPQDLGFAARSTKRQLQRYVTWWTPAHGYLLGQQGELATLARELIELLPGR